MSTFKNAKGNPVLMKMVNAIKIIWEKLMV